MPGHFSSGSLCLGFIELLGSVGLLAVVLFFVCHEKLLQRAAVEPHCMLRLSPAVWIWASVAVLSAQSLLGTALVSVKALVSSVA